MSDDQTELPTIPPDAFAAVLALLALAVDPKATEARLRSLEEHQATAAKATAELATARADFAQHCASERAALAVRADTVSKSEVKLFVRKNQVAAREDAAREVEDAWRHLFESEFVRSGFQSAEFPPLEKARRWLAGLPVVSTDGDYSHTDEEVDTSGTDDAARGNDPAFIATMPPDVTLARSAQSPPRSAKARRGLRRAAEL